MSTIVFAGQRIPTKHLVKETDFKYHPDQPMKDKILEDLKKHLACSLEDYIIDLDIRITLKEYDTQNT